MRLTPRPQDRRPDPPPDGGDARRTILVGTVLWGLALVAAAAMHSTLQAQGRGWWVWTPVAAIPMGLYGLRAARRRP
jgi:hypothetical protein